MSGYGQPRQYIASQFDSNGNFDLDGLNFRPAEAETQRRGAGASAAERSTGTSQNPISISEESETESMDTPQPPRTLEELYDRAKVVGVGSKSKVEPEAHKAFLERYIQVHTAPGGNTSWIPMKENFPDFDKLYKQYVLKEYNKGKNERKA